MRPLTRRSLGRLARDVADRQGADAIGQWEGPGPGVDDVRCRRGRIGGVRRGARAGVVAGADLVEGEALSSAEALVKIRMQVFGRGRSARTLSVGATTNQTLGHGGQDAPLLRTAQDELSGGEALVDPALQAGHQLGGVRDLVEDERGAVEVVGALEGAVEAIGGVTQRLPESADVVR